MTMGERCRGGFQQQQNTRQTFTHHHPTRQRFVNQQKNAANRGTKAQCAKVFLRIYFWGVICFVGCVFPFRFQISGFRKIADLSLKKPKSSCSWKEVDVFLPDPHLSSKTRQEGTGGPLINENRPVFLGRFFCKENTSNPLSFEKKWLETTTTWICHFRCWENKFLPKWWV